MKLAERKISAIHGYGLFAKRHIAKGKLIINWLKDSEIIGPSQYDSENQTGIRLIGNLFIDGERDDSDYINHSDDPNCVYLFGMVFAAKDLEQGEELTLNYRHFLPADEINVVKGTDPFVDIVRQVMYLLIHWSELRL